MNEYVGERVSELLTSSINLNLNFLWPWQFSLSHNRKATGKQTGDALGRIALENGNIIPSMSYNWTWQMFTGVFSCSKIPTLETSASNWLAKSPAVTFV